MKIPNPDSIKNSAISYLREIEAHQAADILSRSKLEIQTARRYGNTTALGLNITLRCRANDISLLQDESNFFTLPTDEMTFIQKSIESVLPVEFKVHEIAPRSLLVERTEFEKSEIEQLIDAQKDLMISVATGGPRIQNKNDEYKQRRIQIKEKLRAIGKKDPNPFEDLWAWYARWSSGDLPSYQSRRSYIKELYQSLLENLYFEGDESPAEPRRDPTGWEKVDRIVDSIIQNLSKATVTEEFQTIGLLCRECMIALAQAVYIPEKHKTIDGKTPSKTDAYRMLEAYFSTEYSGPDNEALRRHAKASLSLANELQHKTTATYKYAALCSEATRTVVNIVVISTGKR
ncbi:MAG TPA: hypothetical protein PLK94_06125 [Alphaproteobacteria bacterium]|nr:hypothetical protein [Alphaproteobacteria bacterium]